MPTAPTVAFLLVEWDVVGTIKDNGIWLWNECGARSNWIIVFGCTEKSIVRHFPENDEQNHVSKFLNSVKF